jgi:transglutaminase-like putative cysteine protease
VRITVTANGIGSGLGALPGVLVPYSGANDWVRTVIVLGAGVLLLDAALVLALTPRSLGDLRRAGAALPLVALAVVPSTLARPGLPYVHGLLLFALLAAFIWGERLGTGEVGAAFLMCVLAAVGALIAAPALDTHKPWLNYQALAGTLAPAHAEVFDWNQTYGPLRWPRSGREIVDVQARYPEYWKVENLDTFDGTAWTLPQAQLPELPLSGPGEATPQQRASWTEQIKVTIRAMSTINVIASGEAREPQNISGEVVPGPTPGTWITGSVLSPGDSYTVEVTNPNPKPNQLRSAGTLYPPEANDYLTLSLPASFVPRAGPVPPVTFAPFHSDLAMQLAGAPAADARTFVERSPYAPAYALARRLAAASKTPYDYVENVLAFLSRGFKYNERPAPSLYPLRTFLFKTKLGYCQQFSGAMALLLRMGGIPARVGAGFTTGTFNSATGQYVVTDVDAHDWVEAWFPHYGWVRFDPTPGVAPARGGHARLAALPGGGATENLQPGLRRPQETQGPTQSTPTRRVGHSSSPVPAILAALAAVALLLALVRVVRRPSEPAEDNLVHELERALHRAGRPIARGVTLAELEQRFRASPAAEAYVRTIRLSRFAGGVDVPTAAQRRALRGQLAAGLGLSGALRALWALPPKPRPRLPRWFRGRRGIHSE